MMRKPLISVMLVVALAGSAVYWLHDPRPAQAVEGAADIATRAVAAYNAGKLQEALPLFKQWAGLPEVRNDPEKLKVPLAFVQDIEQRLAAGGAATQPGKALDPGQVMKNAARTAATQRSTTQPGAARVPHKKPVAGEVVELAVKDLGNFPFDPEKDEDVPADVHLLDGAKVRLKGYMLTLTQAEQITKFAVVPSLLSCCFGQPPGPEHVIVATTPAGKSVEFSMDELEVEGVLHVKPLRKDGYTYSLFELDVTGVRTRE